MTGHSPAEFPVHDRFPVISTCMQIALHYKAGPIVP
jgi:hypothetical protein